MPNKFEEKKTKNVKKLYLVLQKCLHKTYNVASPTRIQNDFKYYANCEACSS